MKTLCSGLRLFFSMVLCLATIGAAGVPQAEKADSGSGIPARNPEPAPKPFKFQVSVDLVTVDVHVVGRSSADLNAEDFVIYDNGDPQEMIHFSRDQFPLAVAILVDSSPSIQTYLSMLQIAALSALRQLKPEDQVVLYSFDIRRRRLTDLTQDRALIAEQISRIRIPDTYGTFVYDPIADAALYLAKKAPGMRHAIIMISDNWHVASFDGQTGGYSAKAARDEALKAGATVYSIQTPSDIPANMDTPDSMKKIRWIAEETGGEQVRIDSPAALQGVLEKAILNLRLQYTLGFTPSHPGDKGSFHKLSIQLAGKDRCPGCSLLARSGYYAGLSQAPHLLADAPNAPKAASRELDHRLTAQSIRAAAMSLEELHDIAFQAVASRRMGPKNQPEVQVDVRIEPSGIAFKSVDGKHTCSLRVTIFYANSKGKFLGSLSRTLEGSLSPETYDRVRMSGIPFSATVPLKDERQHLRIVVSDEEGQKMGSRFITIP